MISRSKVVAAALGLVVATVAVGDASANTVTKTVVKHGFVAKKTVRVVSGPRHRVVLGGRVIKHIRIVHRAPTVVKFVKASAPRAIAVKTFAKTKIVRVSKTPLERHAMLHRKATVIR